MSAYEPAIDLAGKLVRYLIHHGRYYGPNGEFLPNYAGPNEAGEADGETDGGQSSTQRFEPGPPPVNNLIHFQHHMVPLLGVLDHAIATEDHELIDFVRRSFEWGRTKGDVLVGYFPENIDNANQLEPSEICEVAGMIDLALKLSTCGAGDNASLPTNRYRGS